MWTRGRESASVLVTDGEPSLVGEPEMHSCWAMLGEFKECHQERAKVPVASRFLPSSGLEGYGSWANVWAQPHGTKQTH